MPCSATPWFPRAEFELYCGRSVIKAQSCAARDITGHFFPGRPRRRRLGTCGRQREQQPADLP
ncbi:hypothetical protein [Streptomyces mirabilis]|uniref:hypothetical protein n=1 Tax=Streptomyces mirabilis TaxID=68239 RepID=UPI00368F3354